MIMTDQQRYDSLGCYGNKGVHTPNLDRIAEEGVRFDQCYCNATICTPSRASILTGLPLCGHGVYKLHDVLPPEQVLLPERLRRLGYTTALCGKLHVSGRIEEAEKRHPNDGFDVYNYCLDPAGLHFNSPLNGYAQWLREKDPQFYELVLEKGKQIEHFPADLHYSKWAAESAVHFIENAPKGKPFFCKLSFFDPHDPYMDYPEEYGQMVDVKNLPPVRPLLEGNAPIPEGAQRERDRPIQPHGAQAEDLVRRSRIGYYASIAFLDNQIGRVMEVIENRGLADNTIVLFVSDHGDMLGDKGLLTKGAYFYDPSSRVPFLLRYPGTLPGNTVCKHLVQPHDIAATLLAAGGMNPDERKTLMPHSMNLLRLLEEGDTYEQYRDYAVTLYRNSGYGPGGTYFDPPIYCSMFRDTRYKLSIYHRASGEGYYEGVPGDSRPDKGTSMEGELYDMEADPLETINLWNKPEYQENKWSLISRLMDWMVKMDVAYVGSRGGERVARNKTLIK
jgi:arylsulfatase A-like enzyme